jgi:hypothetical protein
MKRRAHCVSLIMIFAIAIAVHATDAVKWPTLLRNDKARLVHLKYQGGDWDQGMRKGSDYNLLPKLKELTGVPIAAKTEHMTPKELKETDNGQLPAFLFVTGSRGIRLSKEEITILRWYCVEKYGMLFFDNGGGNFNQAVEKLLALVFPERKLFDIPNDDPIYQKPYQFPNGAPPLWHHSGRRALGIKEKDRWIVFYHQGDINDAWQTGHSGVSKTVEESAYKMGINVMYYAHTTFAQSQNTTKKAAEQPAAQVQSEGAPSD